VSARADDPAVLVEAARVHLAAVIRPLVPAARRYDAAMIQNALAIASRQLADGGATAAAERAALAGWLAAAGIAPGDDPARTLKSALRSGRLDDADVTGLWRLLASSVTARLRICNPKATPPSEEPVR
jgi:hypothetical protein